MAKHAPMAGMAPRAMKKTRNVEALEKRGFNMQGYGLATPSNEASIRFKFPPAIDSNKDNPFENASTSLQDSMSR